MLSWRVRPNSRHRAARDEKLALRSQQKKRFADCMRDAYIHTCTLKLYTSVCGIVGNAPSAQDPQQSVALTSLRGAAVCVTVAAPQQATKQI